MVPTAEELPIGTKAYEQVRIYETYTARNLRQLPWILACCFGALLAVLYFRHSNHPHSDSIFAFVAFPIFLIVGQTQAIIAKKWYISNKMILRLLEEKYGDSLPWKENEKVLVAVRDLEAAIQREQSAI